MEVTPGIYYAQWKGKESTRLVVVVSGESPFFVMDVFEHLKPGECMAVSDVKMHKKPIEFIKRIEELDK